MLPLLLGCAQEHTSEPALGPPDIVVSVDRATDGIAYQGGGFERRLLGPQALTGNPEDGFVILDGTGNVVEVGPGGETLPLSGPLAEGTILAVDAEADELAVLQITPGGPSAVLVTRAGGVHDETDVPAPWTPTGISLESGELFVEVGGGERRRVRATLDPTQAGNAQSLGVGPPETRWTPEPIAPLDPGRLIVSTRLLSTRPDGSYLVVVDELGGGASIVVDTTVRAFSADGAPLGMTRVPRDLWVDDPLTVGVDGSVYAMVAHPDRVDIVRLTLHDVLKVLPEGEASRADAASEPIPCTATVDQILASATAITEFVPDVPASAIAKNGTCDGWTAPSNWSGVGLPYAWGQNDNIDSFTACMEAARTGEGFKAGDVSVGATLTCACGTDCSGFVSTCWGYPRKLSTGSIPSVSDHVDGVAWEPGDVANKAGEHVVMFDRLEGDGALWFEATVGPEADAAVRMFRKWGYVAGYDHRRYRGICR